MPKPALYDTGTILLGVVGYSVGLIFFGFALWSMHDLIQAYRRGDEPTQKDEGGKFAGNLAYALIAITLTRTFM